MPTTHSYRYFGLLFAATAWLGLIWIAPWLRSQENNWDGLAYFFFHSVCHQQPDRSFSLWGYPFAVCARCTGLYLGFWIGLITIPNLKRVHDIIARRPRILILFAVPMLIDVLLPGINTHWSRLATGALASFPVSAPVWWGISQIGRSAKIEGASHVPTKA